MTARGVVTGAGERLGVGDRVMTRRNDRDLAVANRDTWTITGIDPDGTLTVHRRRARRQSRSLPAGVRARARRARLRHHRPRRPGRDHPHRPPRPGRAHHRRRGLRRDDPRPRGQRRPPGRREPRRRPAALGRDLRPRPRRPRTRSRRACAQPRTSSGTPPTAPSRPHWPTCAPPGPDEQDLRDALARCREPPRTSWPSYGEPDPTWIAELHAEVDELRDQLTTATNQVRALLHEPAIRSLPPGRIEQEHADWLQDRRARTASRPRPTGSTLNHLPAQPRPTALPATRAHLTEAEASADDPHHRSTPPRQPRGEHMW